MEGRGKGRPAKENRLLTYPLVLLILSAFASFFGYQLLLSVIPLYAGRIGGGNTGAGLATGLFMLSTVLTQIQMPRILPRLGYRLSLVSGLVFLGLPALAYPSTGTLLTVLVVTLTRGIGFGIITVLFSALVAELAPEDRRGEAIGILGISITIPTIFCNSLGLWLVHHAGYAVTFVIGGAAPLAGLFAAAGIGAPPPGRDDSGGFLEGLRRGPLLGILLLFTASTMALGVFFTFLPLHNPGSGVYSATGALLAEGASSTLARWWAGRFGDRHDPRAPLVPGMLAGAIGMVLMTSGGPLLLVGALLFGSGLGAVQNSTLLVIMARVPRTEYGLASALWNAAFDGGTGIGAFIFGLVISGWGFSPAFYLCALSLACATLIVPLDRRRLSS
ncbi:MFS transporter [Rubrobacter calidifluminis]|uniref:MFS transporter n=1 Tax=Rubrobacter calidifluminis TaxID=1392640 RepID=UPI00235E337D|nr:MFS transporter [Rubrobacter calidifluminis]